MRINPAELVRFEVDGNQAMRFASDGVDIIMSGRVAFRDEDLNAVAAARGTGEALAAAWRRFGVDMLAHIGGEFLIAIWDAARQHALVAVDRFSSRSLYWGERDGRLAFATSPLRVCELLGRAVEVDLRAIHAYVYFHVVPAPLSIASGVSRLDIGQAIRLGGGSHEVFDHWTPAFVEDAVFEFGREKRDFLAALRTGVSQCTAGIPRERLGCFLSGGTDSSTIAGLVTQAYGAPARTFSIGFDVSGYDESHYSRLAAQHFGTEHTEYVLTPDDALEAIDVVASAYEQPFGNSSAVPTYVCARLAHEGGILRMLGGDGGDELYGGNERYATQRLFSLYEKVPGALRGSVLEPLLRPGLGGDSLPVIRKLRSYVEQARVPLPDRLNAKYNLLNRFGPDVVFTDVVMSAVPAFVPVELERTVWRRCRARSQINRLLAYDFKFTLGDNDLPKVTRMCHAAGAQVAYPMLSDAVTDHSLRLRPDQKLRGGRLRYFFREALRGFLPEEIVEKPKHGFGMPFGDWLLSQPRLAALADDALAGLAERGLIRARFLRDLRDSLHGGHAGYYGTMVWVLMVLELWLRRHNLADFRAGPSR